jgi:hypothetical protein
MRGGAQAHLLRASDSHFYVTKFRNNPQHIRILTNEYFGTKLAASLGLPMPEVMVIEVSDWLISNTPGLKIETAGMSVPCASGLQLASRYVADPQEATVFDYLPEAMLEKLINLADFLGVLVFDKWTCNSDGRQAVFVKHSSEHFYRAIFIDQGYCFNAGEWSFPDSPLRGIFARNFVYERVSGWESFEPVLSRVEQIDLAGLWNIARNVPEEWYQHDTEALSRLIESLHQRCSLVRDLITSFRTSTRNPFPNWTAIQSRSSDSTRQKQRSKTTEMTDNTLKLVIVFDPETGGYKRAAHNLSAAQAVEQFSADGRAKIIDQGQRHRTSDLMKCKACKTAADEATKKHNDASSGREQEEQEPAASEESESE